MTIQNTAPTFSALKAASFAIQTTFAVGKSPYSVSMADVNGDSKLDVVTANSGDNNVSVLLGNGQGNFAAQTTVAVGNYPLSVSIADVNVDGKPDLVTANRSGDTVSILLGDGQGNFATKTTLTIGLMPYSVSVADVNGDSKLDVITSNYNNGDFKGTVSLLLGDGQGGFAKPTTFTVGASPKSVSMADVNGDSKLDVITANSGDNNVSVLLGNGQGNFAAHTTFKVGALPNSVSVADVNGDGKLDILTTNGGSDAVSVLLGDGQGSFASQKNFTVGAGHTITYGKSVSVADVNGDGNADLVTANNNSISVLVGDGRGGFTAPTIFTEGLYPNAVSVMDVNNDGNADVVTANDSGNISVLLNSQSDVSAELNKSVLFASTADVFDAELYAQGNYNNAHLSLQRDGTANVSDVFGTKSVNFGTNNPISFANGILSYSGTSIGTVTQNNGKLDLAFNSNATQSAVTTTLRSLTYTNVGNGASEKITLDWTFSDGNTGSQGEGGVGTVTGTSVVNITDLTPPFVNNFSPIQGATNVAFNSDIVLIFNEPIQRGTVDIVLKNSIGTLIATYDAASSSNLSITGNTLTINPSSDLAFSTRYIVELASGSVKDLSGNVYSGASGYSFTTTASNSLPTGSVTITGKAEQNQTLSVNNSLEDADGLGVINYQWLSDGNLISGATQSTYTLTATDVGKTISVKASYTDLQGTAESVTSSTTALIAPPANYPPTGNVTISGTASQNQTLTVSDMLADDNGLGTVSYQWLSEGIAITGANQTTYTLTQTDVGKNISVSASYTDGLGKLESVTSDSVQIDNVNDEPTGSLTITGEAKVGATLSVQNTLVDADGINDLTFTWFGNGEFLGNGKNLLLTNAQKDLSVNVVANYVDNYRNTEEVSSDTTGNVIALNHAPTGKITVKGVAKVGSELSLSNTLKDADGLGDFSYQWLSDGVEIDNATQKTYSLTKAEVGKKVSVAVSYTDGLDNFESIASIETTAVKAVTAISGLTKTGDAKNNKLSGLAGDDTLIGGLGVDTLTGGKGTDTFKYTTVKDSGTTATTRDTIIDFKHTEGDKIDLSAIDANAKMAGDQAFTFIGTKAFSTKDATGQLRFDVATNILYGSTNADKQPEFSILLSGVKSLVADDLIL